MGVWWLGLDAFSAGAQVESLVRELRSCKLHDVAKRTKTNKQKKKTTKKKRRRRKEKG